MVPRDLMPSHSESPAESATSSSALSVANGHRFHAFFTTADPTILDTIAAEKTHRAHAIIE